MASDIISEILQELDGISWESEYISRGLYLCEDNNITLDNKTSVKILGQVEMLNKILENIRIEVDKH